MVMRRRLQLGYELAGWSLVFEFGGDCPFRPPIQGRGSPITDLLSRLIDPRAGP
jgi:hypothetical protein